MNKRIIYSVLIILMTAATMGGATLAWFTAEAVIGENTFTAGTLTIEADENEGLLWEGPDNWNPGDCTEKEITLEVTGSKRAYIRAFITETWTLLDVNGNPLATVSYFERNAPNVKWKLDNGDLDKDNWPEWDYNMWQLIKDPNDANKEWWYYKGMLDPNVVDGPKLITVLSEVCLDGPGTGNEYQGATYTLAINFEAIQVTNEAVNDVWGVEWNEGTGEWDLVV